MTLATSTPNKKCNYVPLILRLGVNKTKYCIVWLAFHKSFLLFPAPWYHGRYSGRNWTTCIPYHRVWRRWRWRPPSTSRVTTLYRILNLMFLRGMLLSSNYFLLSLTWHKLIILIAHVKNLILLWSFQNLPGFKYFSSIDHVNLSNISYFCDTFNKCLEYLVLPT